MPEFIGRHGELKALEDAYKGGDSAFIPVYGRRRVGKSELILRFMSDKPGIYFLGKKAPPGLQIREFLEEASAVLNEPLLAVFPAESWRAALEAVVERWKGKRKLILAFDEFQWTAGSSPELPSVLQEQWDRKWKQAGSLFVILCGSYIGFMERKVLGRESPLFGRRTAQIFLKPFAYREAAAFHPNYSVVERAKTYFICGGIPLYLRFFSDRVSVETNVKDQILNEYAALHREPDFLLREELREVENYYAILLAVATGDTSNRAISSRTGIGERSLHYYLQQLVDLGYLCRRYPMTGEKNVPRHVRFDLDDPLLRFWFRFVFPQTSYIAQMGTQRAMHDRIRPELASYFGFGFERLCREALPVLYEREKVPASFHVGEYWDRSTQIDVVGFRDDGWIDIGECKWGAVRSWKKLEEELEKKVSKYPNRQNATIGRRIFTRLKLKAKGPATGRIKVHNLEDLYK